MPVRCQAQRLPNPFRGVMNIIRYASAEAVIVNGLHGDIYANNGELVKDLEDGHKVATSDIR